MHASRPRSRRAHTSAAARIPPLAITGRSVSSSTRPYRARSGPSIVPSRAMDVTRNLGAPAWSSVRTACSTAGPCSCHPCVITCPSRTSTATTTASATRSTHSDTKPGSSAAAVPRIARAAPSSSAASTAASVRRPPPSCTGTATRRQMSFTTPRFDPSPRAASRSTTWTRRAPSASKRRATSAGSSW